MSGSMWDVFFEREAGERVLDQAEMLRTGLTLRGRLLALREQIFGRC